MSIIGNESPPFLIGICMYVLLVDSVIWVRGISHYEPHILVFRSASQGCKNQ